MYVLFRFTLYGGFLFFLCFISFFTALIFFFEKVKISYGRYETQDTSAGTVEETGYESLQTLKMKTTVFQIILEAP